MKKGILIVFILMTLAQWLVPGKMIYDSETTLDEGTEFRFKTRPVDPSDPFRGKYITLSFEAERWTTTDTIMKYYPNMPVYVSLDSDSAGFARINGMYIERPPDLDIHLVKAKVSYASVHQGKQEIVIQYPFERFYVEESKASEAEQLYWQNQRDSTQIVYALVKIKNDRAVLRDVRINERSIMEIVKELNASQE